MHENEFEKQVQQKMEELQFVPSDAVWKHVDKEINKEEKRRRPLFWLFFFLGLMLLGGGYYFMADKKGSRIASNNPDNKISADQNKIQNVQAGEEKKIKEQNEKKEDEAMKDVMKSEKQKVKNGSLPKSKEKTYSDKPGSSENELAIKIESSAEKEKTVTKNQKKQAIGKTGFNSPENKEAGKSQTPNDDERKNETVTPKSGVTQPENLVANNKNITDTFLEKKSTVGNVQNISVKDSSDKNKTAGDKLSKKKSSSWKIGYTASAGVSSIYQTIFKPAYTTNPSYANAVTGPGTYYYGASKIRSGFSFSAGAFVNKNLSKRVSFSAGLGYHYYSTKISTGQFVDSSKTLNNNASQAPIVVQGYYTYGTGYDYTNHYHFIELPVLLSLQVNKAKKLPLLWEGGFSLSYLAATNALHFEPSTGVYYKDNKQFNKIQFNATISLMMGFHFHKNELQIGPQLQYGLTGLLNKNTGNPEHLFFAGIKSFIMLQKK